MRPLKCICIAYNFVLPETAVLVLYIMTVNYGYTYYVFTT